jgi:hypothetical protein
MWPNWSLDGLFIIFCSFTFLNTAFFIILHQCYESIFKLLDPLMLYVILHICFFLIMKNTDLFVNYLFLHL